MKIRGTFSLPVSLLTIAFQFFLRASIGSPGDDLDEFQDCRFQCEQITCYKNPYNLIQEEIRDEVDDDFEFYYYNPDWKFDEMPLPFYLRLLFWDCEQNCDYQCQRIITNERKQRNEEVFQFHGKWPFQRIYGIQEFLSMVFSIGNFIVHILGFTRIVRNFNSEINFKLKYQYTNVLLVSFITMLAWIFSTVFHIRDFLFTERLDYYFAGLTVLSSFHLIISRLFYLYLPSKVLWRWIFILICMLAYIGHVYRLIVDWSYTYNMRANIAIGILQNVCLCFLCFKLYFKYYELENIEKTLNLKHLKYINFKRIFLPSFYSRSPKLYSLYPLLLSFIVILGMSLEIFDFPPFFFDLIDAHSLWHLVTIFPAYYGWYDWMIWDINENIWHDIKEFEKKKND